MADNWNGNNNWGNNSNYRNGRNHSNNGNNNSRPQKKHSGSKFKTKKDGRIYVSGWNYSKQRGFITVYAVAYQKAKEVVSERGIHWIGCYVRVVYHKTGQVLETSSMIDLTNKRMTVKELNMIATTKGKGGYFGKQF